MTLRERIMARLALAEAAADRSESDSQGHWKAVVDQCYDGYRHWDEWYIGGVRLPFEMKATAVFIADRDPAAVIAECQADLALLDWLEAEELAGSNAATDNLNARYPSEVSS